MKGIDREAERVRNWRERDTPQTQTSNQTKHSVLLAITIQ